MKYIVIGGAVLAVLLVGGYFTLQEKGVFPVSGEERERQVYESERYGFGFDVPSGYEYLEYVPEVIAIGRRDANGEGFESQADVRLFTAGEDVAYENYDAFVFDMLRNSCAADGPNETIYCEELEQRQPFTTSSGLSGEVVYLTRTHENFATGELRKDGFGPHFVFDMSANVPDAWFAVLVVGAPAYLPADAVESDLVRVVAESVRLDEVVARFEKRLVLVTDVSTADGETIITVDEVEWLQGDAAYAAVTEDTECTEASAEECVASLANNFYVRNTTKEYETFMVDPAVQVQIQEQAQLTDGTIGDIDERVEAYGTVLATIETRNDTVISIEEMYLP